MKNCWFSAYFTLKPYFTASPNSSVLVVNIKYDMVYQPMNIANSWCYGKKQNKKLIINSKYIQVATSLKQAIKWGSRWKLQYIR